MLLGLILAGAGCSPRGADALRRGDELMAAGRVSEAIPVLERAVADLPGNAAAWNQLGIAYHAAGRRGEAQKAYLRALKDDRDFFDAHYNLGALEFELGRWREAERSLRTYLGVESSRTNAIAWQMLGDSLLASGDFEAADRALMTAARLMVSNAPVYNSLGLAAVSRRRFKDAQAYFQEALRLNPRDAVAQLNLAIVTQQLGDRQGAVEQYRSYLAMNPGASDTASVVELVRQLEAQLAPPPGLATNRIRTTNVVEAPARPAPRTNAPASEPTRIVRVTNPPSPPVVVAVTNPPARPALAEAAPTNAPLVRIAPAVPPRPEVPMETVPVTEAPVLRPARDAAPPESARTIPARQAPASAPAEEGSPPPPVPNPGEVTAPARGAGSGATLATTGPATGEDKTFWQKVSPANWGNPVRWFRDDEDANATNRAPARTAQRPPPPATNRVARAPAPNPAQNPTVRPSPPPASNPAPPPAKPVIPRYARRGLPSAAPGNRAAAEVHAREAETQADQTAALAAWQRTIRTDPSWTAAWMQLGLLGLETGNAGIALEAGEAATALDPASAPAHQLFAASLARSGYPKDAADQLERAAALAPGNAQLHLALAGLYARDLGDPEAAKPHYERVLTLDPRHPQASAIRLWLANNP